MEKFLKDKGTLAEKHTKSPLPRQVLKEVFGYDQFRPLQAEIIGQALAGKDALVIMPTGGGKSICYQIPALILEGLTIVVSPLISLMKDQVEQLQEVGAAAAMLNSSLAPAEYGDTITKIRQRQLKLLYMAPETLLKPDILELLDSVPVDCLTIDEAHCISEWGHDFRPEYRQIAPIRQRFPNAVCLALTATATPRVQDDICENLGISDAGRFIASFNRENLFLQVQLKHDPARQTVEFLKRFPKQSGIIYCFSRRQVETLCEFLRKQGFSALPYHAGLGDEARKQHQEQFIRDDVQIIVATIAFGMGINKSNVRFVVHYDLPKSIESYYQEIGRAGRDGVRADCLLLFSAGDTQKIRYFIDQKPDALQRQVALQHLDRLVDFAETEACRRRPLIRYFGEDYDAERCGMCDNCLSEKQEKIDITVPAQKFLSCVFRTGQRFGAAHIIDVLRGSRNQKVQQFSHDRLTTYGIGKEFSKKQWSHLSRQLVRQGLLEKEPAYGGLKLTQRAGEVFAGRAKVFGTIQEEPLAPARAETPANYDAALFELLREKRKALADAANVPPYVIFSDKSLIDMASFFPQSAARFSDMHGVGQVKLERYGAGFLEIIRNYCREHNLAEVPASRPAAPARTSRKTPLQKLRHQVVGEAFRGGASLEDLMAEYGTKRSTLISYLYQYYQEGQRLPAERLLPASQLPPAQREKVLQIFERLGTQKLRPVFDALNGEVAYEELHILRLYYLNRKKIK